MGQFTQLLTELIEQAGGQNALARAAGLDISVPSRLLSGKRKPTMYIIIKLREAYPAYAERLERALVDEVAGAMADDIRKQDGTQEEQEASDEA